MKPYLSTTSNVTVMNNENAVGLVKTNQMFLQINIHVFLADKWVSFTYNLGLIKNTEWERWQRPLVHNGINSFY